MINLVIIIMVFLHFSYIAVASASIHASLRFYGQYFWQYSVQAIGCFSN